MSPLEYVRHCFREMPDGAQQQLLASFEDVVGRPPDLTDTVKLCHLFSLELRDAGMELPEALALSEPEGPARKRRRGSSRPKVDTCEQCFYCDMPLAPTHHHDHFPLPHRLGGTAIVPACVNCHTLKDSVDFDTWPGLGGIALMGQIIKKLTPTERILFAKMGMVAIDSLAMLKDKQR